MIDPDKLNAAAVEAAQGAFHDGFANAPYAREIIAAFLNALLADDKAMYRAVATWLLNEDGEKSADAMRAALTDAVTGGEEMMAQPTKGASFLILAAEDTPGVEAVTLRVGQVIGVLAEGRDLRLVNEAGTTLLVLRGPDVVITAADLDAWRRLQAAAREVLGEWEDGDGS